MVDPSETGFDPKKAQSRKLVVPKLKDAVEGWRAWKLETEIPPFGVPPKLYSATFGYYWAPKRAAAAECGRGCDEPGMGGVPGEQCSCGFYSAKWLLDSDADAQDPHPGLMSLGYHLYEVDESKGGWWTVIGQIACWGKVIEGSHGWRSQYAYPVRLWLPFEAHELIKPLRQAYGVPVKLKNWLKVQEEMKKDRDREKEVA
jgi:hypothetical protein